MSEDEFTGDVSRVHFTWATNPEKPDGRELCVIANLNNGTRVHFDFVDDGGTGTRELQQIIGAIPLMLKHIRQEQMIKRESDELDKDLFNLLGDDDA